jgi:hypothetical protein
VGFHRIPTQSFSTDASGHSQILPTSHTQHSTPTPRAAPGINASRQPSSRRCGGDGGRLAGALARCEGRRVCRGNSAQSGATVQAPRAKQKGGQGVACRPRTSLFRMNVGLGEGWEVRLCKHVRLMQVGGVGGGGGKARKGHGSSSITAQRAITAPTGRQNHCAQRPEPRVGNGCSNEAWQGVAHHSPLAQQRTCWEGGGLGCGGPDRVCGGSESVIWMGQALSTEFH